jgi:tetratricopeptide (TPR) repeat protein
MAAETLSIRYFYVEKALEMMATAVLSVNLAEEAGSTKLVPRSYAALGVVVSLMKRFSLAEDYLARGVRGARELNDPSAICATLLNTALYHSGNGRLAEGERHCREAHQLIYTVDDPRHQGMADSALGHAAFYQGRLEEALSHYTNLRKNAVARNNNQYAIWGLFASARSHLYLGQFDESLALLLEAASGLEKTPELQSEVICYGLLALTYLRLGKRDLARATADKELACIKRSKPVGYPALDGYVACAETYLELWLEQPTKKAPAELTQSIAALRAFANTLPIANPACLWVEGRLAFALGQTEKATGLLRESAALAQTFGMPLNEAQALYHLSKLPLPTPIQEQHRSDAKKIFSRLGASYYSDLLRA